MQIVLPGALPDAAIAQELAAHIEKKAPCFVGWLQRAQAHVVPAAPKNTFCTPYEYWQLTRHGFKPQTGERPSAALGAVLARESGIQPTAEQPLWVAQLVHVAPARDGAALIPAGELEITAQEYAALFDSAAEYFAGSGFTAAHFDAQHWRIEPPTGFQPECASPGLVGVTSVNDWWTQDAEGRPWRRLVNELQMLWFDHPVNQARQRRGLRPINSLWLYGGAAPNRLTTSDTAMSEPPKVLRALQGPSLVQDWGSWLLELERLDQEEFASLPVMPRLVLTGSDRYVELSSRRPGFFDRLVGRKQDWRRWWSRPN